MKIIRDKKTQKFTIKVTITKISKKRILRDRLIEAVVIDRMARGIL